VKVCERIAGNMLREVSDLLKKRGITTTFSPGVRVQLAKLGFSEEFGARELKRLLKRRIEDPITELILDKDLGAGSTITVRVKNGEFAFSASTGATKTASLQPA
jgi:ATP-dependent Clp protease ATP-binding subunit ClpC